jgi:serine/threonine protein kinase
MISKPRYLYKNNIGKGGFGEVALYSDTSLDRLVAIKVIKPIEGVIADGDEVRLVSLVDSQHVVTIYDVFYKSNNLIIVQEYLSGDSIESYMGKVDVDIFLKISYQIVKGLRDIHKVNVCHRDIKPENMRFDEEGILKIFDFGISKSGKVHDTIKGNASINYAAPEIFLLADGANKVEITTAYDIFSCGVCLWFLLTGKLENFNHRLPYYIGYPQYENFLPNISKELKLALSDTVTTNPIDRPTALKLSLLLEREILKDKHIAKFVHGNATYKIDKNKRVENIGFPNNYFTISYNGYEFLVTNIIGVVLFNNMTIKLGDPIPEACVITLKTERVVFVSYLSSNPEIIL